MLRHSLLLSIRHFLRYPGSFLINLTSLATGLFAAIIIYLWVHDEWRVDKLHRNAERLFVVLKNATTPSGIITFDETPGILSEALVREMPDVLHATAVIAPHKENNRGIFIAGDNNNIEATDLCVGSDFFTVFSFPLLQGDRKNVLDGMHDCVISDELSGKLFHTTENVIGRQVQWNRGQMSGIYTISGVFTKTPAHSSLQFDVLFNYDLFLSKNEKLKSWKNGGPVTYLVLKEGTDRYQFNSKIKNYIQQKGGKEQLFIQKFADRYLFGQYENGVPSGGRIGYVRLFSLTAIFLLVVACINFMNLSTTQAITRLKEVGIKKVLGALRLTLAWQYIGEAIIIAMLSLLVALPAVWLLLPWFNQIAGKQLTLSLDSSLISGILAITFFTGLLAGSYPAAYLSGHQPVNILKGKIAIPLAQLWARKGLVIFQFVISLILLVSVLVVYKQVQLIQKKNLGYDRGNVFYFKLKDTAATGNGTGKMGTKELQYESFLQEIRNIPGVESAAGFRHNIAAGREGGTTDVQWAGKNVNEEIQFTDIAGGYDFIETLGISMKEGRSYSSQFPDDKSKIIFNEAAIAAMGLIEPVGKNVRIWGEDKQIIGVVYNFNFQSLYESIKPCFIELNTRPDNSQIMVRYKGGKVAETIAMVQELYRPRNMGLPFEFRFLDEDYQTLYVSEQRVEALSGYFATIVIAISLLGLIGLASFTIRKRYREIGIRKLLGCSDMKILWLLWKEFNMIIVLTLLISLPVSYLILKNWLNAFVYRIDLSAGYFLIAAVAMMMITMLTVLAQTIIAARFRLAETLRSE